MAFDEKQENKFVSLHVDKSLEEIGSWTNAFHALEVETGRAK